MTTDLVQQIERQCERLAELESCRRSLIASGHLAAARAYARSIAAQKAAITRTSNRIASGY